MALEQQSVAGLEMIQLTTAAPIGAAKASDPVVNSDKLSNCLKSIVASSFYNVLGIFPQLFGRAGLGLAVPLLLQPEVYGEYTYFVWLITILIQLTTAGLPQAAQRFIPRADSSAQRSSVALFLIKTGITATALVLFVFLSWSLVFSRLWRQGHAGLAVLAIAVLTGSFSTVCSGVLKGYDRFSSVTFAETIGQTLRLGALGILWLCHAPLTAIVLLSLEPLYWAAQGLYFSRKLTATFVPSSGIRIESAVILKYAASVAFVAMFDLAVWQRMEIAFLMHYTGAKEAGIFNLALQISTLLIAFPSAAVSALFPWFSSLHASDPSRLRKLYSTAETLLWILVFPLVAIGLCLTPLLIVRVYGTSYEQVTAILPFVLVPRACLLVGGIGSTLLYATGQQRDLMRLSVLGAGLSVLGNFLLVPRFGLIGAGICMAITQAVITVITLVIVHRTMMLTMPIRAQTLCIGLLAATAGGILSAKGWPIVGTVLILALYAEACRRDGAVCHAVSFTAYKLRHRGSD